jgi:mRNA interferase RelE/StbE
MERYRLVFRKSVAKDLRRLPKKDVSRVLKCVRRLAEDPRGPGSEKLSGEERYRVRVGAYRVVYEIKDDALIVVVVTVAHRRDIYRAS